MHENLLWNKEGVQPHQAVLIKKSKERMETVLCVTCIFENVVRLCE